MLCILYLKSIHKIVYNKKLINIDWLMLHSLQETKCDALLLLLLQPTQTKFKQQQPQQQQKTTQFKYENSTKASKLHFSDLQYIYISIYASYISYSQLRYYDQLLMGPNQIYPTFWINILQDLHRESSHFQVLMRFLKRVRESASRISIGTCFQSWLERYGIASSPYFSERGFSVWKMWKFRRLYVFSLNSKISLIMSGECPFRYL